MRCRPVMGRVSVPLVMEQPVLDVNICTINDRGCVCVCPPYYHNRTKSTSAASLGFTWGST